MWVNFPGLEFLGAALKFTKERKHPSLSHIGKFLVLLRQKACSCEIAVLLIKPIAFSEVLTSVVVA